MSDGDYRAASRQLSEGLLNLLFRFGIKRRSGFIEQKDWRVFKHRARDGKTLLLTAGKTTSLIANDCLVSLRLGHNEIVRVGCSRRFANFFRRGIEPAELDIVEDRIVKQERFLSNEPDLF